MATSPKTAPKDAVTKKTASATSSNGRKGSNHNDIGHGAGSNAAVDIQPRLNQQQNAPAPTQLYLRNALDALLTGRPVLPVRTEAVGCLVE